MGTVSAGTPVFGAVGADCYPRCIPHQRRLGTPARRVVQLRIEQGIDLRCIQGPGHGR